MCGVRNLADYNHVDIRKPCKAFISGNPIVLSDSEQSDYCTFNEIFIYVCVSSLDKGPFCAFFIKLRNMF